MTKGDVWIKLSTNINITYHFIDFGTTNFLLYITIFLNTKLKYPCKTIKELLNSQGYIWIYYFTPRFFFPFVDLDFHIDCSSGGLWIQVGLTNWLYKSLKMEKKKVGFLSFDIIIIEKESN